MTTSRARLLISLATLLVLAITQVAIYEEDGWSVSVMLLATVVVANLARNFRRRG